MSTATFSHAAQARIQKPINAALFQLSVTANKAHNLTQGRSKVLSYVSSNPSVNLIVLPEIWQSLYGTQHFATYAEDFGGLWGKIKGQTSSREQGVERSERRWSIDNENSAGAVELGEDCKSESLLMLSKLAKETGCVVVGGSIPEREDDRLYNTASVFDEKGRIISLFRKVHLFDIDVPGMKFQESLTLSPGDQVTMFDCSLGRFGLAICYDMRFPELAQIASRAGACGMIYPGAFNTTTGPRSWELLLRARAADNQLYVLGCSPARPPARDLEVEKYYPAWGHSTVVDPWGTVLATTDETDSVVTAKLEKEIVEACRKGLPVSTQRRFDLYADVSREGPSGKGEAPR
ncbi:Carbon-nitrogen hydrolase [Ceraceosorus bombacis]|uniref:Carbon-nitrogen hydrolase n=1 Tax=Ceraceosorus bombacis TaxID=401625 RepID=A0A0P1BMV1_9BASI|nr:Carbon-nitrogen hydrolase [Ceraceosorus bombacis]